MKSVRNLGLENSIFNQYISELRNVNVQGDRMRFRRNLERLGQIFAYEISKTFQYIWARWCPIPTISMPH